MSAAMSCSAGATRASSVRPSTRGTISTARIPRITTPTMTSTRVKPARVCLFTKRIISPATDYAPAMFRGMSARWATVILGLALVASLTEWALKLAARRTPAEPLVVLPAADLEPRGRQVDVLPLARLLGAAGSSEVGGMRALGIMADAASGRGIAVIAVEGQPPRAYRTG